MTNKQKREKAFRELLKAPSPSGFEKAGSEVVQYYARKFADKVVTDTMGNTIATINPGKKQKVMLVGHIDQLGMQILSIDANGFCRFNLVGGYDHNVLVGQYVIIHTKNGVVNGVLGSKAVHLQSPEERKKKNDSKKMFIDIGASSKKEAEKLISIGDYATFRLEPTKLAGTKIACAGLDDKAGVYVVMRALEILSKKKDKLDIGVCAVASVQEELGTRGAQTSAFGIMPIAGIAVDVSFAMDHPELDKRAEADIKMGAGPILTTGANINLVLEKIFRKTAKKNKINLQLNPVAGATGTDARALQLTGAGVPTSLISIPNRYMHTPVEVVDMKDLEAAAKLIAATVMKIKKNTNFRPW